jgi:DNA-directed RNA polymerase-3 subunit RPC5
MSDAEDEVIGEMPVFLSQDLASNLHLLQYPLRPMGRPYSQDLGQLLSVRVKPMQKKFEIEYALDPASQNYDKNGPEHPIKKMKLSSHPVPPKTNYAIGVVREGQLHLTPLHAVCRMLPNLEHIDEAELAERVPEPVKEEASDVAPMLVKFNRKETERSAAYQKVTHAYMKQIQDQEAFVDLQLHPSNSVQTSAICENLVSPSSLPVDFDVAAPDYLAHMNPSAKELAVKDPDAALKAKCVFQIVTMLKRARVIPFGAICSQLKPLILAKTRDAAKLNTAMHDMVRHALKVCEANAYLVQGNWVCKSSLVLKGRASLCRDYLITQFAKARTVDRARLADVLRLDHKEAQVLYEELGVRKGQGEWEMKLPTDARFLETFSEVGKAQVG